MTCRQHSSEAAAGDLEDQAHLLPHPSGHGERSVERDVPWPTGQVCGHRRSAQGAWQPRLLSGKQIWSHTDQGLTFQSLFVGSDKLMHSLIPVKTFICIHLCKLYCTRPLLTQKEGERKIRKLLVSSVFKSSHSNNSSNIIYYIIHPKYPLLSCCL